MAHTGRTDAEAQFLPTRRSLLSRLKDWDDQASWREFFDTYSRLIYATAVRAGLTETEAQDVVQETVVSVAHKMRDFKYDPALGSFKSWLRQITHRRIVDHLRRRARSVPIRKPVTHLDSRRTATVEQVADPASVNLEAFWEVEWKKNLMNAAVQRVKDKVRLKHFQIFHRQVLKGLPPAQVAREFGVSVAQVYLVKHRLTRLIRKETELLEDRFF